MRYALYSLILILFIACLIIFVFMPSSYVYEGEQWTHTLKGAVLLLSIIDVFVFLGVFGLFCLVYQVALFFNEWILGVNEMSWWFNYYYLPWLYAKNRKKWIKWEIFQDLIFTFLIGTSLFGLMSDRHITGETLVTSIWYSIPVVIIFSVIFYKWYVSRLEASNHSTFCADSWSNQ